MIDYRDNYYGSILDPIHGDIKLSEIEKWCISHPLFSRLRKVKQNTFLYYVFPSANHTRFEHSIGVMHLAGKIFDACKENFATGEKKKEKYQEPTQNSFFNLNNLGENEEIYYQELRLAALLHDIGHGPLSHLFDSFLMSRESFFEMIRADEDLNLALASFEMICPGDSRVEHEHISCAFLIKIIRELKTQLSTNKDKFSKSAQNIIPLISPERIIKLIEPKFLVTDDFVDSKGNNYSNFFSKIISAFPLDADRMDYLLRDSYFSGVNYGYYDINRLFASFMTTQKENEVFLTIKESGLDSVLRFIQSRTHLYNQVYFHKTNRAANTMLLASTSTNKGIIKLLDGKKIEDVIEFYIKNSDEHFINETVPNQISSTNSEKGLIIDLLQRKLCKRVFEHKIVLLPKSFIKKDEIDKIVKVIEQKLKVLDSQGKSAYIDSYANETFKDSTKALNIAIKDKQTGRYNIVDEWNKINQEYANANMLSIMVRVYVRRTFLNSNEFKTLKKEILELIHEETDKLLKIDND